MFLKSILSRISPYIFNDIDKIDPTKEGLLDFCPRCDEKLADKKVITLKRHEKLKHPESDKALIKQFIMAPFVIVPLLLIILAGSAILMVEVGNVISEYYDDVDGYTQSNKCFDTARQMYVELYEQKMFTESNLEQLQYLETECGMYMGLMPPNDSNIFPTQERKNVFEDEDAYKKNLEKLVESGLR